MGITVRHDGRPLPRALVASVFLHALLFALLLPILSVPQSEGDAPVESLSFARVIRVHIDRPAPAPLAKALPNARVKDSKVHFARQQRELTSNIQKPHARPTAQAGPIGTARKATAPQRQIAKAAPLYAQAPASTMPASVNRSSTLQTPQPESTLSSRDVATNGAANSGGELPFTAAQDPVLDPAVLHQLQNAVSVHVTLLVTVGDDGRTKHVAFSPPIDPTLESKIESLLASANWDAAVCGGGITCEGTATIKL